MKDFKMPLVQMIGREERKAAKLVIDSDHWTEGAYCNEFKEALRHFLGVDNINLTNSGSSANLVAIMAMLESHKIGRKKFVKGRSQVITTALCFPTTVSPIIYGGAIPVFVDIDLGTYNANISEVKNAINTNTVGIILAHTLGNPFNIDYIKNLARNHGLWVIEDGCDALGSTWNGKMVNTFFDIGTSSFYPAHHMTTIEGGAVYSNDPMLSRTVGQFINWGRDCWCQPNCSNTCGRRFSWQMGNLPLGYDHKYTFSQLGFNLKMNDVQAAIGIEQLKKVGGFIEQRKLNHDFWETLLRPLKVFMPHFQLEEADASWFGYVIMPKPDVNFNNRAFRDYLETNGIETRALFAGNITKQPMLYKKGHNIIVHDLSNTDYVMGNAFWVGVQPSLTDKHRGQITKIVKKYFNE